MVDRCSETLVLEKRKGKKKMKRIIGAVEIGTSKAKALVGEVGENGNLSIVGMASRPNDGMRKGEIVDFRKGRRRSCRTRRSREDVGYHR